MTEVTGYGLVVLRRLLLHIQTVILNVVCSRADKLSMITSGADVGTLRRTSLLGWCW